jgi:hypothetical protein
MFGPTDRTLPRLRRFLTDVELVTPFPLLAIEDLASSDLDQAALHHGFKRLPLKKIDG